MTPKKAQRSRPTDTPDPDSLLPLTPAIMHVLLALAATELHGYAIMSEVKSLSEDRFKLGAGTLYRSLQRMVRDGLIVETQGPVDMQWDDERRRYYRLTQFGRAVASAEASRIEDLAVIARQRGLL